MVLDSKLLFHDYLVVVFTEERKTIGLLRKLNSILRRAGLVKILKTFVRPHLEYGDVLCNLESVQYNTCLAITRAIRDTSRDKPYQELGLEFLQLGRWC